MSKEWEQRYADARRKHQEAMSQKKRLDKGFTPASKGFTKAVEEGPIRLPDAIFERLGGKVNELDALKVCDVCGVIQPKRFANGYVPQKCKCQIAAMEEEKQRQAHATQQEKQRAQDRKSCEKCYSWLGPQWSVTGLERKTFDNFVADTDYQITGFSKAFTFAENMTGNIVFFSDHSWGTGKTHLASAICNTYLAQGIPCRFASAQNLFNAIAARMDAHEGYSDLLAQAGSTPLLVLDDLEKVHRAESTFKQSIFFELFNMRYIRHLPTVITTNALVEYSEDDVTGISEYIGRAATSRLCDMANGGLEIVDMNGRDYRRVKRER